MSEQPRGLSSFVAELKRRHVFRTFIAYGAAAFVVLQGAEIVLPAFEVGEWALQLTVVLAVLGLPVVLALAWVYEITPRGIRTMKALDVEGGRPVHGGSMMPRVALLVVTVLAAGAAAAYWVRTSVPGVEPDPVGPAAGEAAPAFRPASDEDRDVPIRSLAVLPLQSYAPPSEGEAGAAEGDYFAAGMHEALISQLSRMGTSFRVISRTTVQQYDASGRSIAQIGEDLGVEGVVEGSVVFDGDRVRITVQLIHAPSDTHLWSADYERELEDIIALQREVATAIARAILGELDETTAGQVMAEGEEATPEADPEAAMAEMKGRVALSAADEGDEGAVEEAQRQFEIALEQDSSYAPALVGLAGSTLIKELSGGVPSPEVIARVRSQVERAVQADPRNAEARDLRTLLSRIGAEVPDVPAPQAPHVMTDLGARIAVMSHTGDHETAGRDARLEAARTLRSVGRTRQAREVLEGLVEDFPDLEEAWQELEQLLVTTGRVGDVVALRERRAAAGARGVVEGGPSLEALAEAIGEDGARGYWEWRLEEIEALERAGIDVSPVDEATCYAALGDAARAFEALRRAAEEGADLRTLRSDPTWDPYRRDPLFRETLRKAFEEGFDWRFETGGQGGRRPGG